MLILLRMNRSNTQFNRIYLEFWAGIQSSIYPRIYSSLSFHSSLCNIEIV